ncbi:olfactory receptor 483-like [Mesocricetus auratus]|uniref:Olfactory receptor n=1 Tax=Mesocricetus auratus TaxID=10036 RepID=A0A1U7QND4_MESAU|nr:olfactory receptor 483-like [Mesocricetus auratus]
MAFLEDGNHTAVTEFILLGLTDDPVLRVVLFIIILCIYLVTVSGNLSTILLIRVSSQLHHPMYFFLSHLASVDIGMSSSVTPNMLVNFLASQSTISYLGCGIQLSSADFFGSVECFILAAMAYDRFIAICNPLLYSVKLSAQVCVLLVMGSYVGGFLNAFFAIVYFFSFIFCGPNRINHFFCDLAPVMELSCSDVTVFVVVTSFSAGSVIMITVFVITISYSYILITILKMHSTEGRQKAFSTCTSHLTAVTLYYGTITFIYVMPKSSYSTNQNKVVSLFYMVVIPMLNPLIYSLRNKEMKDALKRQLEIEEP